jgi:hypothetical protein
LYLCRICCPFFQSIHDHDDDNIMMMMMTMMRGGGSGGGCVVGIMLISSCWQIKLCSGFGSLLGKST